MSRIVVIGGGGYLGELLVDHLVGRDHRVYVTVRKNANILVTNEKAKVIAGEMPRKAIDVIINLAYPSGGKQYRAKADNLSICRTMCEIADEYTRIIQISSLAVFGVNLDQKQSNEILKRRRDNSYVENKIDMERRLAKIFRDGRLDIIRLGNIWGPGSRLWTQGLAERIFFGLPVAVKEEDGFSNCTDVQNAISYITFIAELHDSNAPKIHHLAEFSDIKWSYWINKVARILDMDPVYITDCPTSYQSHLMELVHLIAFPNTNGSLLKRLWASRFTASYLRSILTKLPNNIINLIENKYRSGRDGGEGQSTFHTVMSCKVKYENLLDNRWILKIPLESSWDKVKEWLDKVGYLR